jgi:hypothetical protein
VPPAVALSARNRVRVQREVSGLSSRLLHMRIRIGIVCAWNRGLSTRRALQRSLARTQDAGPSVMT